MTSPAKPTKEAKEKVIEQLTQDYKVAEERFLKRYFAKVADKILEGRPENYVFDGLEESDDESGDGGTQRAKRSRKGTPKKAEPTTPKKEERVFSINELKVLVIIDILFKTKTVAFADTSRSSIKAKKNKPISPIILQLLHRLGVPGTHGKTQALATRWEQAQGVNWHDQVKKKITADELEHLKKTVINALPPWRPFEFLDKDIEVKNIEYEQEEFEAWLSNHNASEWEKINGVYKHAEFPRYTIRVKIDANRAGNSDQAAAPVDNDDNDEDDDNNYADDDNDDEEGEDDADSADDKKPVKHEQK